MQKLFFKVLISKTVVGAGEVCEEFVEELHVRGDEWVWDLARLHQPVEEVGVVRRQCFGGLEEGAQELQIVGLVLQGV